MGAVISTILTHMFSFVASVAKTFIKSLVPFCVFSLVSSVSICVSLLEVCGDHLYQSCLYIS